MFPTLLSLGPLKITTQGLILALTFFFSSFWLWKRGREEHFEEDSLMDMVILMTLGGLLFARLFYVLSFPHFPSFWQAFQFIRFPGFSWPGALVGGLLVFFFFTRQKKWDFFLLADIMIPPLVLAQALGRLGNFFSGSFYGRATRLPIGLVFPGQESPRHPLQLYAFILYLLFLRLILKLESEYRFYAWYQGKRREALPGFIFFTYFIAAGLIQLGLAFFLDSWLYWKGIPLIFLFPILEILTGMVGLYWRSGHEFKGQDRFLQLRMALAGLGGKKPALKKRRQFLGFKSKTRIKVGKQIDEN